MRVILAAGAMLCFAQLLMTSHCAGFMPNAVKKIPRRLSQESTGRETLLENYRPCHHVHIIYTLHIVLSIRVYAIHTYIYIYIYIHIHIYIYGLGVVLGMCMYVCICIYGMLCKYLHIYIYIGIYIYIC